MFFFFSFQHVVVTIILGNVGLIKNFIFSPVENPVVSVFNANIILLVDIVIIARKPSIAIRIYQ